MQASHATKGLTPVIHPQFSRYSHERNQKMRKEEEQLAQRSTHLLRYTRSKTPHLHATFTPLE